MNTYYFKEVSGAQYRDLTSETSFDRSSTTFIGVLKTAPFYACANGVIGPLSNDQTCRFSSTMKVEFAALNSSYNVLSVTTGCSALFGLSLETIRNGVSCNSLIPNFVERLSELEEAGNNEYEDFN